MTYRLSAFALALLIGLSQRAGAQVPAPAQNDPRMDSLIADRTKHVNEVLESIKGKESLPAEQVFKNIQRMKGMPANRVLAIMNRGYSNSLGVSCSHCHVVGEWDSEEKDTKQIAREMSDMAATINNDLLKKIKNIKSENPFVNCGTCHNGKPRPGVAGGG